MLDNQASQGRGALAVVAPGQRAFDRRVGGVVLRSEIAKRGPHEVRVFAELGCGIVSSERGQAHTQTIVDAHVVERVSLDAQCLAHQVDASVAIAQLRGGDRQPHPRCTPLRATSGQLGEEAQRVIGASVGEGRPAGGLVDQGQLCFEREERVEPVRGEAPPRVGAGSMVETPS